VSAVFTILSAVAEAERDRTRERVAEVKRDQRQRGRYLGGAVPWGYRVGEAGELVPIPEQQAAIRRMRKLRDQGLALRAIAEKMKGAGVSISMRGEERPAVPKHGRVSRGRLYKRFYDSGQQAD
jgi:DNA invertase Pin-like site-specific DNA recombinase